MERFSFGWNNGSCSLVLAGFISRFSCGSSVLRCLCCRGCRVALVCQEKGLQYSIKSRLDEKIYTSPRVHKTCFYCIGILSQI